MYGRINQPVGQVRLTNVAIVKISKKGTRFEIACYRNKVVNWRNGVESDINEVLQSPFIFENVTRGITAKKKKLKECFGTSEVEDVAKVILEEGELQVSDLEREEHFQRINRDIAGIVVSKSYNPRTGLPYPLSQIQNAMREIHYNPHPTRKAKQQALEVIKLLSEIMPIDRNRMQIRIVGVDFEDMETRQEFCRMLIEQEKRQLAENANDNDDDEEKKSSTTEEEASPEFQVKTSTMDTILQQAGSLQPLPSASEVIFSSFSLSLVRLLPSSSNENESGLIVQLVIEPFLYREVMKFVEEVGGVITVVDMNVRVVRDMSHFSPRRKEREDREEEEGEEGGKGQEEQEEQEEEEQQQEEENGLYSSTPTKFSCRKCNLFFHSSDDQKEHFRGDLHRLNLKLKMLERSVVSPSTFENMNQEEKDEILNSFTS